MILVGSDILIAHLRGVEDARVWRLDARQWTDGSQSASCRSQTSRGMRSGERRELTRLLDSFQPATVYRAIG